MKNRKLRLHNLLGIEPKTGERIWTRLSVEDQKEVFSRVSQSNPPAKIIRELVSKGLEFERLQACQATHFTPDVSSSIQKLQEEMALIKRILCSFFISTAADFDFPLDQKNPQFVNQIYSLCLEQINHTLNVLTAPQGEKSSEKLAQDNQLKTTNSLLKEQQ
jgi:hypothetical protein